MCAFMTRAVALIPIVLLATSAWAGTISVNFDSDDTSNPNKGEFFTSVDSSLIHFSDTDGPDLFLANAAISPSASNALAVFFDGTSSRPDDSALRIDFDFTADSLSLDFGTALVGRDVGDAVLTLIRDGAPVDQVVMALPQNGTLERHTYDTGMLFDAVELDFLNPELTEIVDNLTVNAIPEPTAALVFGFGSILFGRVCGRGPRATRSRPTRRC